MGQTDPILRKNKKTILQFFLPTGFFLIYYFLLFGKNEK